MRWSDSDALGHVNAARYLTYFEDLLADWLTPVVGDDYVVARFELDFRYEIRHGTRAVLATGWIERLGTTSMTFGAQFAPDDAEPACTARAVAVVWDPQTRRPRPLTAAERLALAG